MNQPLHHPPPLDEVAALHHPPPLDEVAALWRANRARLAGAHRARAALTDGRPAHMKVELTNYCNLACPLCPHVLMQRPVGYMAPALFRRIIDDAAPELEFIYLHHLGESLFHGRIGELIAYARSRGVATGLSTNATFLDERKARALLTSGLDFLVISLDAASLAAYQQLRVGGDFVATTRHVRDFLELRRNHGAGPTVVVQMILAEANRHEVERFGAEWSASGAQVVVKEARDWAGQVKLPGITSPPRRSDACRMPWTELTVLWDGRVVPCVNFYEPSHVLGDLSCQTVDEVWNGPPMRRLRQLHLADQVDGVPVCATCPRHAFDHDGFVAEDQLTARLHNYVRTDLRPVSGLS